LAVVPTALGILDGNPSKPETEKQLAASPRDAVAMRKRLSRRAIERFLNYDEWFGQHAGWPKRIDSQAVPRRPRMLRRFLVASGIDPAVDGWSCLPPNALAAFSRWALDHRPGRLAERTASS
jgi:hypothetical protein